MQALWLLGPTAMMVSAVVTTAVVAVLDFNIFVEGGLQDMLARVQAHPRALAV